MDYYLGLSGGPRGSHEPGVALVDDQGNLSFVYEEERFNRYKSSISCFPTYSLKAALSAITDTNKVQHAATPGLTYDDMHLRWPLYLDHNFRINVPIKHFHHQLCHAATAYYSSNFNDSLIVSLDGLGDRASGIIAIGTNGDIMVKKYLPLSSSIGQYWALMCQYIGYDGLEDAYKTMGLAPYGSAIYDLSDILSYSEHRIRLNKSFLLNKYEFVSKHPSEPIYSELMPAFVSRSSRRRPTECLRSLDNNIAASAQKHLEGILLEFFSDLQKKYQLKRLCFAGGVAMNSHFNGVLQDSGIFESIYIPPFPGDCGLAAGSAQLLYKSVTGMRPKPLTSPYLGSSYTSHEVSRLLDSVGVLYRPVSYAEVADLLYKGSVIAFFEGRAECGPRALGARSILANPCIVGIKDIVNSSIKYRELYRPFAPVTTIEALHEYFKVYSANCSFMSFAVQAKAITQKLAPEIVHVDNTSRVQSAPPNTHIHSLILEFAKLSGVPILLNTSFNLKGEPNVESPKDALRTFFSSGLKYLYISGYLVSKCS